MYTLGSTEFNQIIETPNNQSVKKRLVLLDNGTIIDKIKSLTLYSSSSSQELQLGTTNMAYIDAEVESDLLLTNREVRLECGVTLSDGSEEYIPMGVFTIQKPQGDIDFVKFKAHDNMQKFEKVYSSELTYPTTSDLVLDEICNMCGVTLSTPIENPIEITEKLQGYTCREVLGFIAGIHGKFACIDRLGTLNLRWYSETPIDKQIGLIWAFNKSDDDFTVDKIEIAKDTETNYTSGSGFSAIYHSNPLATQEIADDLFAKLDGFTYNASTIDILDDIRLDIWDVIKVIYLDGKDYLIPCMSLKQDFGQGSTSIQSFAKSNTENEYRYNGAMTNYVNRIAMELLLTNRIVATKVDAEYVNSVAITTENLDAITANITNLVVETIDGKYATIDFANIDVANINKTNIGLLFAEVGLLDRATIVDGHVTGFLDAVEVNANKITAGTLIADRILLSGGENGVLYALNNLGELTSTNVDTLDGYVLTDRTITADKIIANSITAKELDVNQIFGNEAVLNKLVSQEIFSDAVATNTVVVGVSKDAKDALDLANSTNTASGSPILLTDSADGTLIDFKAYGRSTQDGTPTPDAPIEIESVADDGTLEVKSEGKNLIPYPYKDTTKTEKGIKFVDNRNGTIEVSGDATDSTSFILCRDLVLQAGTYTFSGGVNGGAWATYHLRIAKSDGTYITLYDANAKTFTLSKVDTVTILISVGVGTSIESITFKPMLRRVEVTDDTYELYKSSSVSIPLSEPLRSIDNVKDEIACVDGVYGVIRRIGSKVFDGSDDEKWTSHNQYVDHFYILNKDIGNLKVNSKAICSHYSWCPNVEKVDYGIQIGNNLNIKNKDITSLANWKTELKANPITTDYILANEVFEPFENQALFDNIATYDNVTFITATDNAEMEVEYYRNTSTGIQLAKLAGIEQDNSRLLANWASDNDITLIDGAKIYTGSITAKSIDIADLFADTAFINALSTNSIIVGATNKAEQAINSVSKTVKGITIHYLATTANSGVTTSTSGWTTTVQQINATKKYLWTYQTITYADNTTTDTSPVISGVYGNEGTNGVGITSVTPLYYLKSNTTAPSTPTSAVTSTSTGSGVWTTAIPKYVSGYTYFTCTQTQYTDGTYKWSTVVADNALTNANKTANTANTNASNAVTTANTANTTANTANSTATTANNTANAIKNNIYKSGTTLIDGGKIYTDTLFSKDINMTGTFTATNSAWIRPSWEDTQTVANYYFGEREAEATGKPNPYSLTDAQKKAFDFNMNGSIDLQDLTTCKLLAISPEKTIQEVINEYGYEPINSAVKVVIDPSNPDKVIQLTTTNSFGREVDIYFGTLGIDVPMVNTNSISCANIYAKSTIQCEDDVYANYGLDTQVSLLGLQDKVNYLQPHGYSLIRYNDIGELTTTQKTYTLFNGRKMSDYGMLLITIGVSATDIRETMYIPTLVFSGSDSLPRTLYLECWTDSGATFNQVRIDYVSDTQIKAYLVTSTTKTKYLNIYGVKVDAALSGRSVDGYF